MTKTAKNDEKPSETKSASSVELVTDSMKELSMSKTEENKTEKEEPVSADKSAKSASKQPSEDDSAVFEESANKSENLDSENVVAAGDNGANSGTVQKPAHQQKGKVFKAIF